MNSVMNPFGDAINQLVWAQFWQVTIVIAGAGLIARLGCGRRPHLAYVLWLVVLAKCLTPPLWSSPTGIFSWTMPRIVVPADVASATSTPTTLPTAGPLAAPANQEIASSSQKLPAAPAARTPEMVSTAAPDASPQLRKPDLPGTDGRFARWLWVGWAVGAAAYAGFALLVAIGCWRTIRRSRAPRDETLVALLETLAQRLRVRRKTRLVLVSEPLGPMTFGWIRPTIVVPQALTTGRSAVNLEPLLAHELVHVRRGDALVGLLQVAAQCLWWFHPLVWWANRQIGRERERCCDEEVIAGLACQPAVYARCLINVLELKRQLRWLRPLPGLRPFEVTKQRLEHLMQHSVSFRTRMPRAYWLLLIVGVLLVAPGARLANSTDERATTSVKQDPPTARPEPAIRALASAEAQPSESPGGTPKPGQKPVENAAARPSRSPRIIEASPKLGETGVSADLKEIRVTFDRDMGKGMSWTGGPPFFPPVDRNRKARWINARTCVLPVKLEKGSYYRVGINSDSFRNFRTTRGITVPPSALYFATEGASEEVRGRLRVPNIVALKPANAAADVDPATTELRVTFDVPMGKGMSWTGSGPNFPKSPSDSQAEWSSDGKTCVLPVSLEPGHSYRLGFNSRSFINFQSESGVPLEPVIYQFRTREAGK
jgi:beta-lactamase regulating signal transducer with metallopeptidase domain